MFSSYLRASLVALVASAVAVSAAPGLIVKKSSPEIEVDGSLDKRALGSIVKKSSPEVEVDGSLDKRAAFPAAPGLIAKRSSPEVEVDGNLDKRATYDYTKSDYFTAIDSNVPRKALISPPFWGAPNAEYFIYQSSRWIIDGGAANYEHFAKNIPPQ